MCTENKDSEARTDIDDAKGGHAPKKGMPGSGTAPAASDEPAETSSAEDVRVGAEHLGSEGDTAARDVPEEGTDSESFDVRETNRPAAVSADSEKSGEEGVPSRSADISQWLAGIASQITSLQAAFDHKIRYDHGREAIIDRLHAEIQEYKADIALKLVKPFALGLIELYDDVGKTLDAYAGLEAVPQTQKLLELYEEFRIDIADLLDRNGFVMFTVPDNNFDPKLQRAVRRAKTADESNDRLIAERIRPGFTYGDRVIRPEMVAVFVYEPNSET